MSYVIQLAASFIAVVIVLTLHEFAHSYVAVKCGDPTPKWNGRLTLNPLRHFDLVGLLCFAFVGFGWAKPVPINPNNFKKYRLGMALTASAGVVMNYLTAFLVFPVYLAVVHYLYPILPSYSYTFLSGIFYLIFAYSLSFCVFNLLPFYPLDGFRVMDALNKRRGKIYRFLRQYGYYILLFLIAESFICNLFVRFGVTQMDYLNILGWVMQFATDILGWPITALWGAHPMVNRENFESNVDYTTVLSNFEGPLDLLLFLINKEEIEIKDIFVSEVTEQFLGYMRGLPYLDVDKVSDYLNIAATILKIKAQSLVPNLEEDPELDMEIEEDKAELIRALEEFSLIKEETKKLKELETIGYFFKEPDKHVGETRTVFSLDNLTLDGLVSAFSKLLIKQEYARAQDEIREIPRDEYTVEEKIHFVMETVESGESVRFEQLFTKDHTKSEIVTTFQAILELLKYQYLRVKQSETFGEIVISRNPDRKEEPIGEIDQYD